jgi:hypothetical protein
MPEEMPYKTTLVCKFKEKEVGRIAATAVNAEAYITELANHYGELQIDHEHDENAGMLANLHGGGNRKL